jgi:hypothetical protein
MQVNFLTHFLSILLCRWKLPVARGSVFLFGSVWAETKLYYPSICFATKGKGRSRGAYKPWSRGNRSNGEQAIQSSKQILEEDDDDEVKQAILVSEQLSMQQGRPARTSNQVMQTDTQRRRRRACMQQGRPARTYQEEGEEASGLRCTQLLRTFSEPQQL